MEQVLLEIPIFCSWKQNRDAKTRMKPILRDGVRQKWNSVLEVPLKFLSSMWINEFSKSECLDATGVMSYLSGGRVKDRCVLWGYPL